MYKVFTARNPVEAHLLKGILELDGIDAEVRGEALFGLRPEIGISEDTLPSVWIFDEDQLEAALELVAHHQNR